MTPTLSVCCRASANGWRRTRRAIATWRSRFACTRTRRRCLPCSTRQDSGKPGTTISRAASSLSTAGTRSDMPATPVWLATIESLLNRGIDQSLRARAVAGRLHGTSMELRIEGLAPIRIAAFSGRLALASAGGADADAVIAGPPFALLDLFARREGAAAAPNAERVHITGDAEIAARYR